jgi:hypothetical protein
MNYCYVACKNTLTLKEALQNWTDFDGAMYELALCLGLMTPEVDTFASTKHVYWSDNPVGNALYATLDELTQYGVLEKRDEPDYQFRWNPDFRGSWE